MTRLGSKVPTRGKGPLSHDHRCGGPSHPLPPGTTGTPESAVAPHTEATEQQEGRCPRFSAAPLEGTRAWVLVHPGTPSYQEASSLCSGHEGRWDLDACPDPASGIPGNPGSWLLALCPGLHNSRPPASTQRDLSNPQRSRGQRPTRAGENAWGSQMANRHQSVDRCPGHRVTHD